MLVFFPTPYPDELLYSICARYHQRSGHTSTGHTMLDLFGNRLAAAMVDLPTHINSIVERLPPKTLHTAKELINTHTLLPLYRPFLPIHRAKQLELLMMGKSRAGNIHMTIGQTASCIASIKFLRYCPSCLVDDEQKHGEPYWHRSHQVSWVRVCHLHSVSLLDSEVAVGGVGAKHSLIALDIKDVAPQQGLYQVRDMEHNSWLAAAVHWLINIASFDQPLGLEELRRRYLQHLHRRDLASAYGRLDVQKLIERFREYYGEGFLADQSCGIAANSTNNWLLTLVRKPRKVSNPLHHLVLIKFMDLTIEEFLREKPRDPKPFGVGPWPCLNLASQHHLQMTIKHCNITKNCETGAPVGNFTCFCGFAYARTGPDENLRDRYRFSRIVSVGSVWEETLIRLVVDEGKGLRETARLLSVDPNTVRLHLTKISHAAEISDEKDKKHRKFEICRQERRYKWLILIRDHPEQGVKSLRNSTGADYEWLYRYDNKWLKKNMPHRQQTRNVSRVDWGIRDIELAKKIYRAADKIRGQSRKVTRLTVSSIGKEIGELALLQRKTALLPLSRETLEFLVEDRDQFAIRRVHFASDIMKARNEVLVRWKLARLAGVGQNLSYAVRSEIERIVSQLNK